MIILDDIKQNQFVKYTVAPNDKAKTKNEQKSGGIIYSGSSILSILRGKSTFNFGKSR